MKNLAIVLAGLAVFALSPATSHANGQTEMIGNGNSGGPTSSPTQTSSGNDARKERRNRSGNDKSNGEEAIAKKSQEIVLEPGDIEKISNKKGKKRNKS